MSRRVLRQRVRRYGGDTEDDPPEPLAVWFGTDPEARPTLTHPVASNGLRAYNAGVNRRNRGSAQCD